MRKFRELLKVNILLALMQLNMMRRAKGKGKGGSSASVLIIFVVFMMAYMGWVSNMMYNGFGKLGLGWLLLAFGLMMVTLFTLVAGLYSANAVLFEARDLDQLFTYPVSPFQILFSKVLALAAENWIVGAIFFLPGLVVYCINERPGALFYLYAVTGFFVTPLLPVCVSVLVAYLLGLLTGGMRAKTAINTILTLGMVIGFSFGMQSLFSGFRPSGQDMSLMLSDFKNVYPPLGCLVSAMAGGSVLDWLIGLAWNIVPFAILCGVLSLGYRALFGRNKTTRKATRKKLSFGVHSEFGTLFQKELLRYTSSVMYILNSSIGMVLMTLFIITAGTGGKSMAALEALLPADSKALFALLVFAFTLAITNTTAPSISLEGKNLWIVKSWPVDEEQILRAKLSLHLLVTLPLLAVNCVIAGFTLHIGAGSCLVLFVLGALFAVLGGLLGLIFNLFYHRFDFYSDTQVVKNSASVLLTMLCMALVAGAFAGIYYEWGDRIGLDLFYLLVGVVLAALVAAAASFVFTKGKQMMREIG